MGIMAMGVIILVTKSRKTTDYVVVGISGVALFGSLLYAMTLSSSLPVASGRATGNNLKLQQQMQVMYRKIYNLEMSTDNLNAHISQMNQQISGISTAKLNVSMPATKFSLPPVTQTITGASGTVY